MDRSSSGSRFYSPECVANLATAGATHIRRPSGRKTHAPVLVGAIARLFEAVKEDGAKR
jgi:hypothetical protein